MTTLLSETASLSLVLNEPKKVPEYNLTTMIGVIEISGAMLIVKTKKSKK